MESGTKLGHYEVREQIGAGGMGELCRATYTKLKRGVAVKVLPSEVASDPECRAHPGRPLPAVDQPMEWLVSDVGEWETSRAELGETRRATGGVSTYARRLRICVAFSAAALGVSCSPDGDRDMVVAVSPFTFQEATVATVHAAMAASELTCTELSEVYLRRIEAYDERGPSLNALLLVNPRAMETAAEMDAEFARTGVEGRPLHCIPVILKDNYDTFDMPTTGAAVALAESTPPDDAFVVARLREAGALFIAKSNLTELARGGTTVSSLGGQTRNPYDRTRTPGGSSGGTGAAVAADFGVLGTGSDTGQSIRSPSSANSLVGIRPTRGLVSRDGVIPLSVTQDEIGPIVRTVEDAARMLGVMAGYDPADPITAFGRGKVPESYLAFLDSEGLRGARIGLLQDLQGADAIHEEVNEVVETAIEHMTRLGATVIRFRIPDFEGLTRNIALSDFEFKVGFNRYLDSLGPAAPVNSLEELIASGGLYEPLKAGYEEDQAMEDGLNQPEYRSRLLRREELRQAVMTAMADHDLDAILYPHQQRLVVPIGEDQVERNGVLSNSTGFPAITIPGGFSQPTATAPIGVPIGIELLGPAWSEPELIKLAYAFEQGTMIRRPPPSTPPLP